MTKNPFERNSRASTATTTTTTSCILNGTLEKKTVCKLLICIFAKAEKGNWKRERERERDSEEKLGKSDWQRFCKMKSKNQFHAAFMKKKKNK